MRRVAVVTDTTACIPREQAARHDITVVPVQLIINGRNYRDGIDISPTEFYALQRQEKEIPTTSSSSPEAYLEAYESAGQKAPAVLCITEPSRFSAMVESARIARDIAGTNLQHVTIEVLESTTAAAGQGLVTLAAARVAASDGTLDEVLKTARDTMSGVHLFAALDTLQYLARSGRVPQAAAMVNSLLNIKPIFTLNHNGAHTIAVPRSTDSAMKRILKLMEDKVTGDKSLHVAIMHADAAEIARLMEDKISSRFECEELFTTEFTPVMGAHTGPGLFGVAFYSE